MTFALHLHMTVSIHASVYMCMCVCVCACVRACVSVCLYACMYVQLGLVTIRFYDALLQQKLTPAQETAFVSLYAR